MAFIEAIKRGDGCYWQACRHAERALRARPAWGDHVKRTLSEASNLSPDQIDNRIFAWQLRRFLLTNLRYDSLTWHKIASLPFSFFAVVWRNMDHLGLTDPDRAEAASNWLETAAEEHLSVAAFREQISTPAPFDKRMEKLMQKLYKIYQDSEYNGVPQKLRRALKLTYGRYEQTKGAKCS